jgi:hypothetical protein
MAMRSPRRLVAVGAFLAFSVSAAGVVAQGPLAVIQFNVNIMAATSVRVSSNVLTIDPRGAGIDESVVRQVIEFRAASRTSRDGEVVLTMEPLVPLDQLSGGGAAEGVTTVTYEVVGEGACTGTLRDDGPQPVGRWVGSGVRTGRIVFSVHGPVNPNGVTIPLRFVLTSP